MIILTNMHSKILSREMKFNQLQETMKTMLCIEKQVQEFKPELTSVQTLAKLVRNDTFKF